MEDGAGQVVVISQLPPPVHGSTVMTEVLLGSLDRLGFQWQLVDRRFSASIDAVGKITIRKIFSAGGLICRLLPKITGKSPIRVVFFCTTRTVSFIVDWLLAEFLRLFRAPTINYIHTQGYRDLAERNALFGFMVKRTLKNAYHTVCLSPSLYRDISAWVPAESVSFVANTPRDLPSEAIYPVATPRRVTFLSNLIPGKGIDVFLEVAVGLADRHPDVIFDVVGAPTDDGQIPRLREMVHDAGLSQRVNFAGAVDGDEKWRYLQRATLLVFPSQLIEAQPLTIIEAFACGTPVVAFDVGGIVDLILEGRNGQLVKERTSKAMLHTVDRLLSSPDLLAAYGVQAAQDFAKRFSPETYQREWRKVLFISPKHDRHSILRSWSQLSTRFHPVDRRSSEAPSS